MSEIIYLLGILLSLGVYAIGLVIAWSVIESVYWVYCKIRGIKY